MTAALPARIRRQVWGVRDAYREHIRGQPLEASLLATLSYFVALVIVRAYTTTVGAEPNAPDVAIGGTHIHHVVFGIVAILIAGVLSLDEVGRLFRAALFGAGAALVLDEFALVVFLRDVYWLPEGFLSVIAVVIGLVALLVNAWRGRTFLVAVMRILSRRSAAG